MNVFLMPVQLTLKVEGFPTKLAHHSFRLPMHLVHVLAEVRVFLAALLALQLQWQM